MSSAEELVAAVKARNTEMVKELLDREPGLLHTKTGDGSLLLTAVYNGAHAAAALIKARRTDLDVFEAAAVGDADRLGAILEASPELTSAYNGEGLTPLGIAAVFGQTKAAASLLEHGAEINAMSRSTKPFVPQNTALHAALAGRNWDVAELLVDRGADVNSIDNRGLAPLHNAVFGGNAQVVALLLIKGAEVNVRDQQGRSPLSLAVEKGHAEVADLLRQHGAVDLPGNQTGGKGSF